MVLFSVEIWGTVGQWFGAIGTSVSIAAAAGYYIADQRRNSREQSRQVKMLLYGTSPTLRTKVHNHSSKPIYGVKAYSEKISFAKMIGRKDLWIYNFEDYVESQEDETDEQYMLRYWNSVNHLSATQGTLGMSDFLNPGKSVEFDFMERQHAAMDYWIEYTDARGQRWRIELGREKQRRVRAITPHGPREQSVSNKVIDGYFSNVRRIKAWWWWRRHAERD